MIINAFSFSLKRFDLERSVSQMIVWLCFSTSSCWSCLFYREGFVWSAGLYNWGRSGWCFQYSGSGSIMVLGGLESYIWIWVLLDGLGWLLVLWSVGAMGHFLPWCGSFQAVACGIVDCRIKYLVPACASILEVYPTGKFL